MSSKAGSRRESVARKLAADSSEPAAPSASTAGQAEAEAPVRVFARFRPMNRKELDMKAEQCVQLDQNGTNVEVVAKSASGASKASFTFDGVLGPDSTQQQAYTDCAQWLVSGLLNGLNATCLAYGQTGSGKTFTMEGPELHLLQGEGGGDLVGVIPRMVRGLFEAISAADDALEFTVSVSFVEIYCEQLRDLLVSVDTDAVVAAHTPSSVATPSAAAAAGEESRGTPLRPPTTPSTTPTETATPPVPSRSDPHKRRASTSVLPSSSDAGGSRGGAARRMSALSPSDTPGSRLSDTAGGAGAAHNKLAIREDKAGNVYLEGATEVFVTSPDMVLGVLQAGNESRSVAATAMNSRSSRSHSVFRLQLVKRDTQTLAVTRATLFLVDLAGSEKIKKTHAEGQQLKEGQKINQSLSALGNVINALTDGRSKHIPYRNSKLTRLLQDSLGGNSRTSLIINASPASYNAEETLSSLRFGQRAKTMKNKPTANKEHSPAELKAMLAARDSELKRLKTLLESGGSGAPTAHGSAAHSGTATPSEMQAELEAERSARHELEARLQDAAQQEDALTVARRTAAKASAEAAALKLRLDSSAKATGGLQDTSDELRTRLRQLQEEHEDLKEELQQEQAGSAADRALRCDVEKLLGNLARSVHPVLAARHAAAGGDSGGEEAIKLPAEFLEALQMGREEGSEHPSVLGGGNSSPALAAPTAKPDTPGGDSRGHSVEGDSGDADASSVLHVEADGCVSAEEDARCRDAAEAVAATFRPLKAAVKAGAWAGPDSYSSDLGQLFGCVGGVALSALSAHGSDAARAVEELVAATYSANRAQSALQSLAAERDAASAQHADAAAAADAAQKRVQELLQSATAQAADAATQDGAASALQKAVSAQLQQCIVRLHAAFPGVPAPKQGGVTDVSQLAKSLTQAEGTGVGPTHADELQNAVADLEALVGAVNDAATSQGAQLVALREERDKLLGHLENRVRRVIELEMTLDEAQERFAKLETTKDRPSVQLARENASLRRAMSEQAGRAARDGAAMEGLVAGNAKLNARVQELRNELTATRAELSEVQRTRMQPQWAGPLAQGGGGSQQAVRSAAQAAPVTPGRGVSRAMAASLGIFQAPSASVIQSWTRPVSIRGGGHGVVGGGHDSAAAAAASREQRPPAAHLEQPVPPQPADAASSPLRRSKSFSEHNLPSSLAAFSP